MQIKKYVLDSLVVLKSRSLIRCPQNLNVGKSEEEEVRQMVHDCPFLVVIDDFVAVQGVACILGKGEFLPHHCYART